MNRADWLLERKTYLGGTDAAAVAGVSPYKGPLDVYLEKLGLAGVEETERMAWGTRLEPVIREAYVERTGREVLLAGTVRDPRHPFLGGNPDGLIGDDGILEIKAVGARHADAFGDDGTANVPAYYHCQIAWYLMLTDRKWAHLAALIGGQELRVYTIFRNERLEAALRAKAVAFWESHVLPGQPPSLSESKDAAKAVAAMFPVHADEVLESTAPEAVDSFRDLRAAREAYDAAKLRKEQTETRVKELIGESAGIAVPGVGTVTWKRSKDSQRTDWESVARALKPPEELVASHTTTQPGVRRLLCKFDKEQPQS